MRTLSSQRKKAAVWLFTASMFGSLVATASPQPAGADTVEASCGSQINLNTPVKIESLNISLDGQQVGNSQLLMGLAKKRNLPQRAAEVSIVASLQATSLGSSRLDNRGLFHQKPMYYPGVDVSSVTSSANEFYTRLTKVPNWDKLARGDAANAVQLAKDASTFSRWESAAIELSNARWNAENPTSCEEAPIADRGASQKKLEAKAGQPAEAVDENPGSKPVGPKAPVGDAPTVKAPVDAPTTAGPKAPTDKAPVVGDATTKDPVPKVVGPEAPTGQVPTTRAPSAEAPATEAPATEAPTSASPATEPPVTTAAPTTVAPTTKAPATTSRSTVKKAKPAAILATKNRNLKSVKGIVVRTSISKNLQQMLLAAENDGINLTGTGWRSPNRQIQLRKQNCGSSSFAIYKKSPSLCWPPTARPGTSNHETGLAVDFRNCSTRSTACYRWLNRNAGRYGFKNLPSESWHWSRNGR